MSLVLTIKTILRDTSKRFPTNVMWYMWLFDESKTVDTLMASYKQNEVLANEKEFINRLETIQIQVVSCSDQYNLKTIHN